MTKTADLRDAATQLVGADVVAAGVFSCDVGVLPLGAGAAGGAVAADAVGMTNPALEGVGAVAGMHAAHEVAARAQGLTGIMLIAVTSNDVVLMDWNGNAAWGTGPTRELARFSRKTTEMTAGRRGVNRLVTLQDGQREAKISGSLGWLSSGKQGKRDVLAALGLL